VGRKVGVSTIQEDTVYVKNVALMKLEGQHVIFGWDRDNKWIGGELHLVEPSNGAEEKTTRPFLWKLDIRDRPGNRVRGYERVNEVFFVTTDVEWWAPATPKKE
jgi:hypothetical protein